ncbi:MAG: excinuclease ABC subunit UvrB [bacterium]
MTARFELVADFGPAGDQPQAVERLTEGIRAGQKHQTLLGVTGSGKTFTMANVIARVGLPTLVLSHNKTLAAQLYGEFLQFFPRNAVEYFISYYDYYQPEAYLPAQDVYIEKDADINEEIDRLRLRATASLLARDDVVIVASVSCIYNLGSPAEFREFHLFIERGQRLEVDELTRDLAAIRYERDNVEFRPGNFRVRGDVVDVFPAYEDEALRVEFAGDVVENVWRLEPIAARKLQPLERVAIYPAKHFVTARDKMDRALVAIERELEERLAWFRKRDKVVEAQRLETRTRHDVELLREIGYCPGIENYSRQLAARAEGERPYCLLDYFPEKWLCIVDESHVTLPQVRGMYNGDRARKEVLVEHGFRLPSALDNRPLRFDEFEELVPQLVYMSATPAPYELEHSSQVAEQLIRPTGLVDPPVVVKPAEGQVDDLVGELRDVVSRNERALVTTLTKRMAEDLAEYLAGLDFNVKYLHSELDAIERVEVLRDLRLGEIDVVVGINLLREGLDLPEVSLVAILDADKEGFLRDERSIIQTAGRAARHVGGKVVLYADRVTKSIKNAVRESSRRRRAQLEYNREHGIEPRSIVKSVEAVLATTSVADAGRLEDAPAPEEPADVQAFLALLEYEMRRAAEELAFEKAAVLRDRIRELRGGPGEPSAPTKTRAKKKRRSRRS